MVYATSEERAIARALERGYTTDESMTKLKEGFRWCSRGAHWVKRDIEHFYRTRLGKWDGWCRECRACSIQDRKAAGLPTGGNR